MGKFSGAVIFAGYGITAPEYHYDDYAGIDVKGKIVVVLRHEPQTQVLVKADNAVAYGRVVQAMVVLQHAGATKVGFITEPPPAPARPGS